jgi:hypothetical protein
MNCCAPTACRRSAVSLNEMFRELRMNARCAFGPDRAPRVAIFQFRAHRPPHLIQTHVDDLELSVGHHDTVAARIADEAHRPQDRGRLPPLHDRRRERPP